LSRSSIIDLSMIIVYRTDKALLVKDAEDSDPVWLPLSLVEVEGEAGEVGEITLPDWLAQEKGLI